MKKLNGAIIRYPSKRYGFVGHISYDLVSLLYQGENGEAVTAEQVEKELSLPAWYRKIKGVSFETYQDALDALHDHGYQLPM